MIVSPSGASTDAGSSGQAQVAGQDKLACMHSIYIYMYMYNIIDWEIFVGKKKFTDASYPRKRTSFKF